MFIGKRVVSICVFLFLGLSVALAQEKQGTDDISDAELEQFADALQIIQSISQTSQQDMVKAVEAEELTVEQFTAIQQAQQDPEKEVDASEADLKKFVSATKAIQEIQMASQQKMQQAITEAGMTVERYQEIAAIAQQDPELQQKIQAFFDQ